jgi:D-alanine-D-alanine ligase
MLRVALIFGGRSAEHEISLASARFVADALDPARYELIPVGIAPDGRWRLPEDLDAALAEGIDQSASAAVTLAVDPARPGLIAEDGGYRLVDFAFPVMHGTFAEDGTIQGLLELAGLPYAGAGVAASAVGMDKELMKAVFAADGLPQVDALVLRGSAATGDAALAAVEARFTYPVFVKPCNLGSSVGMTKAHDRGELAPALELAARYDRKVIVEAFADAREFECSVLGNDEPSASVPGEVAPANEFYDYEAKYTDGLMSFTIPAPLTDAQTEEVRDLAVRAFRAVDCAGYARCDFFMERESGRVLLNEINTIPGMTRFSAFPRLWAASGIEAPALMDEIVRLGLERHTSRGRLLTRR